MPSISVRNLPEGLHRALKHRAAEHGRSAEAEVRAILAEVLLPADEVRIGSALRGIGATCGITEDYDPARSPDATQPARFD